MQIENGVYFNLCNMQTFDKDVSEEKQITEKVDETVIVAKEKAQDEKTESEKDDKKAEDNVPYMQILKWNSKEWFYLLSGALLSAATGAIQPIWALLFADVLGLYGSYDCAYNKIIQNMEEDNFNITIEGVEMEFNATQIKAENEVCQTSQFMSKISFYSGMFCVLGAANFLGFFGSITLFGYSGEKLTTRLRTWSFEKILNLEIGFFDDPSHSTGALTTRLSTDASKVQGATGARKVFLKTQEKYFYFNLTGRSFDKSSKVFYTLKQIYGISVWAFKIRRENLIFFQIFLSI